MTTTARLIAATALFCIAAVPTGAGDNSWHKLSLDQTHIVRLISDPARAATLYAASSAGLLTSRDGGQSWVSLGAGSLPRDIPPSAVAVNPHNSKELYLGFDGGGLFKSLDGGETWQAMNEGLPNLTVRCIALNPADPNLVYLGILGGVAISTSAGAYWHMSSGFRRNVNVNAIAVDPGDPQTLYAGTGGAGVFKSGNSGVSWKDMNAGLSSLSIQALHIDPENPAVLLAGAYHPASPTDMYVGETNGGVFRSGDGAQSWRESSLTNIHIFAFAGNPARPNTVYAGAWGGVYRSADRGITWTDINTGLDNAFLHSLNVLPQEPPVVLAGTTFGLLSYTDAAAAVPAPGGGFDAAAELGGAAVILTAGLFFFIRRRKRRAALNKRQPVW
jgi:photosystem II stability/assembly factor-like uncharacterized protein